MYYILFHAFFLTWFSQNVIPPVKHAVSYMFSAKGYAGSHTNVNSMSMCVAALFEIFKRSETKLE